MASSQPHEYEKVCTDDIEASHEQAITKATSTFAHSWHQESDDGRSQEDSYHSSFQQLKIIVSLGWPNCIERYIKL